MDSSLCKDKRSISYISFCVIVIPIRKYTFLKISGVYVVPWMYRLSPVILTWYVYKSRIVLSIRPDQHLASPSSRNGRDWAGFCHDVPSLYCQSRLHSYRHVYISLTISSKYQLSTFKNHFHMNYCLILMCFMFYSIFCQLEFYFLFRLQGIYCFVDAKLWEVSHLFQFIV